MSVFIRVVQAYEQSLLNARHGATEGASSKSAQEQEFLAAFQAQIEHVAKPLFERFVSDAVDYGFSATIEQSRDGRGNPIFALRFVPEKGAKLSLNSASECAYKIKGIPASHEVEHASYFDQRPGKSGLKRDLLPLQSLNAPVLERKLEELLTAALRSRATF